MQGLLAPNYQGMTHYPDPYSPVRVPDLWRMVNNAMEQRRQQWAQFDPLKAVAALQQGQVTPDAELAMEQTLDLMPMGILSTGVKKGAKGIMEALGQTGDPFKPVRNSQKPEPTILLEPGALIRDQAGFNDPATLAVNAARRLPDPQYKGQAGIMEALGQTGDVFAPRNYKVIEQSLGDLPMDQASRMQRAKEQGYLDNVFYHGTSEDVSSFDPKKFGSATGSKSASKGVWLVDKPHTARGYAEYSGKNVPIQKKIKEAEEAEKRGDWDLYDKKLQEAEELEKQFQEEYGQGQNIMPLRARGSFLHRDMKGSEYLDVQNEINDIIRQAKRDKFEGVVFNNLADDVAFNNRPATHVLVFDPKNIRSQFAKFNPSDTESSNLLASMAGLGLLGGTTWGGLLGMKDYTK